jgi:hypothetical protein
MFGRAISRREVVGKFVGVRAASGRGTVGRESNAGTMGDWGTEGGERSTAMRVASVATTDIENYGWLEPKWLRISFH